MGGRRGEGRAKLHLNEGFSNFTLALAGPEFDSLALFLSLINPILLECWGVEKIQNTPKTLTKYFKSLKKIILSKMKGEEGFKISNFTI